MVTGAAGRSTLPGGGFWLNTVGWDLGIVVAVVVVVVGGWVVLVVVAAPTE
jgi:hypothetical protein